MGKPLSVRISTPVGKDRQRPLPLFWNPAMRGSELTGADYPIQPISESTLTMVS